MTLRGRRCRPLRIELGAGAPAEELLARVEGWPGVLCLRGAWADGSALLTSHPIAVAAEADPIAALAEQPEVAGADPDFLGGGWFGRLAFDGASHLAFHDHVIRVLDGRWVFEALWCAERSAALDERLAAWRAALDAEPERPRAWTVGDFSGPAAHRHLAAVELAVELIRAGELYQVNVCTRLGAPFTGSPAALFAAAVATVEPRYGAYLAGEPAIVSLSPELFLRRRGRQVASSPIKGTLPRTVHGNDRALRRSVKDAAENVMIVDLVRNDLGRVGEVGSVHATALLDVQPHPGVWHLVSTVEARLRPDATDADLLRATFPPGSVTGAPKLRALDAIASLEPVGRGIYTGAVGFASPTWGAEFSVAIRTFEVVEGRVELGVGGGITADSVPMLEWRECLHKAAPLIRGAGARFAAELVPADTEPTPAQRGGGLLETILALDGRPLRLADHLARLDRSCRELYGAGAPDDLAERVAAAARTIPAGRAALRVIVTDQLTATVQVAPAGRPPVASALSCVPRAGGLWRHKWADRSWTDAAGPEPIFVAADGTVLETERGNVFLVEPDGTLVTPPLRDDLLPGVTRRAVLDLARDLGRPTALRAFDLAELQRRPAFWTSSLSLAVPIHRVDGIALPRADGFVAGLAHALSGGDRSVR